MEEFNSRANGFLVFLSVAALFIGVSNSVYASRLRSDQSYRVAMNTVVFSPRTLSWKAINSNGVIVKSGRASGGRGYCPDIRRSCRTPTGVYHVVGTGGASCRSSRYPVGRGGAPMPYCMYFSKYYAIHGSYEVPNYNASHGCIRVVPSDAHWLYQNFVRIGTRIVVQPY